MPYWTPARALRLVGLCLFVLVCANCLFLAARMAGATLPTSTTASALRKGFADRILTTDDYRGHFAGIDQYTDCVVFEIGLLGADGILKGALAPHLLAPEGISKAGLVPLVHRCAELKAFLYAGLPADAERNTYTRFWHGPATLLVAALSFMSVDGYRALLLTLSFGVIAACAVLAAMKSRMLLLGLSPLLLMAFAFDEQIGFGQLVSHAPALIAAWAIAGILIARGATLSGGGLTMLAVAAGSVESFTDYLINGPLAAGIYVVVAFAVAVPRWRAISFIGATTRAVGLAVAWFAGFVGTYACKLALTLLVLDWSAVVTPFANQLRFRMSAVDPDIGLTAGGTAGAVWSALVRLGENVDRLSFNEGPRWTIAMLTAGGLGWVWALWRLLRDRSQQRRITAISGLGYITAALILLVWVIALPEHTYRHYWFMIRSVGIWLAAGWGWALTGIALKGLSTETRLGALDHGGNLERLARPLLERSEAD